MKTTDPETLRNEVRRRYGSIATGDASLSAPQGASTCCGNPAGGPAASEGKGACCSHDQQALTLGYTAEELAAVPSEANLGLGCGNPVAIASLQPGMTVLDLGSGAGFDAFLAARAVGPAGRVIGVDMTPEMLSKARANARKSGHAQVEFRLGEIEALPVADGTIDVIISNCVINLCPDKTPVYREAFRVLKPGGRIAVSDVVARGALPEAVHEDLALHTGCLAGATLLSDLLAILRAAGFIDVSVKPRGNSDEVITSWESKKGFESLVFAAEVTARKPLAGDTHSACCCT